MKHCVTNKKAFPSAEAAEDALIEVQVKYNYGPNRGPIAIYKCEDCGQYHLTSRGPMNERLAAYIKQGKVQQQKEADYWLTKLKGGKS